MVLISSIAFLVPTQSITQIESIQNTSATEDQLLYIIRHGESTSNVPDPNTGIKLTSGRSLTIPLTQKGKDQAFQLGKALDAKIKEGSEIVICSSTALRAQQTAQEIFNILSKKNRCLLDTNYDGLCELGQGQWEGVPKNEEYLQELNQWENRSAFDKVIHPKVTSGESYQDVTTRYLPDLQAIVQKHLEKIILIVSHYSAMNAVAVKVNQAELSKEPMSKLPGIELNNCDMMVMKVPLKSGMNDARVITHINCGLE